MALLGFMLLWTCPAWGAEMTLHALDVGQGDALLLRLPEGQTVLVDAGPREAGPRVVTYLRDQGVERIDLLVATHPHEDHIGGMKDVLEAFEVGKVWDSGFVLGSRTQKGFLREIRDRKIRFGKPKGGFSEELGGALVEVLGPLEVLRDTPSDTNNNGLILRVSYGDVSFLLMGDAQKEQRRSVGPLPRSTFLKVAHHGAANGTDKALLRQVRPQGAVISCGVDNPYGHPSPRTVKALEAAKVRWYVTTGGPVVVSTDGDTWKVLSGTPGGNASEDRKDATRKEGSE